MYPRSPIYKAQGEPVAHSAIGSTEITRELLNFSTSTRLQQRRLMKMSNIILFLFMLFVATTLAQPSETEEKAVAEKESESSARMMWYYGCQLWKFPAYAGAFQTGGLKGCTPLDTVYRTSCRGRCVTRAYINPWENANYLNGDHNCCKPTGFQKAVANFKCLPSNGRGSPTVIRKFTYTMITGCQCQPCCKGGPRQ